MNSTKFLRITAILFLLCGIIFFAVSLANQLGVFRAIGLAFFVLGIVFFVISNKQENEK